MRHAGGPIAKITRIGPRHDAVLDYFFVTTGEWQTLNTPGPVRLFMSLSSSFPHGDFADLFETLLPDFVLAFAFFTAIVYAALSRRFDQQRAAGLAAGAVGLALAVGLTWWEYQNDFSVRDLGPIAVGFALLALGGVIFQSVRGIGGSWAGAGIGLGVSLLIGRVLELPWPIDWEAVQPVVIVSLIFGTVAFLLRHHNSVVHVPTLSREALDYRHDARDLYQNHAVSSRLGRGFRFLRDRTDHLHERPQDAQDIMLQLKRMLPVEGWLTERMARLREKAHSVRKGHAARISEIRGQFEQLPSRARLRAGRELSLRYHELKLDKRMERLDKAVAETELRIRKLTQQAQACLQIHDHQSLVQILEQADKLQRHNEKLFKIIDRTEAKLAALAESIANTLKEVNLNETNNPDTGG